MGNKGIKIDHYALNRILKERGISMKKFAAAVGGNYNYVSQVHAGSKLPGQKLIEKIAAFLDIPQDFLMPKLDLSESDVKISEREFRVLSAFGRLNSVQQDAVVLLLEVFADRSLHDAEVAGNRSGSSEREDAGLEKLRNLAADSEQSCKHTAG